jgi:hypothetical protein
MSNGNEISVFFKNKDVYIKKNGITIAEGVFVNDPLNIGDDDVITVNEQAINSIPPLEIVNNTIYRDTFAKDMQNKPETKAVMNEIKKKGKQNEPKPKYQGKKSSKKGGLNKNAIGNKVKKTRKRN